MRSPLGRGERRCGGGAPIEKTVRQDGVDVAALIQALNLAIAGARGP